MTSATDKAHLEKATEHVTKVLKDDAKVSTRDLQERLLKQARMQEHLLYDEASRDAAEVHKRPALSEAPGGFTQMPAALRQAAAQLEYYHTFSGLFPEIHRAWMTIDHVLFLWDYTDPRGSFYQYDGLDQTIIHAALVRPKPGVFEEGATPPWLLLLSTPVEVVVLGLYTSAVGGGPSSGPANAPARSVGEIDIFETGFSVATDGANLLQMVGTPQGRVFMAGADGFLYELTYGTTRGWLDTYRTCAKRNRSRKREVALHFLYSAVYDAADPILDMTFDAERRILYTLSRASTIQMYDLGEHADGFRFVASLEVRTLLARLKDEGLSRGDTEALRKLQADVTASEKAAKSAGASSDAELHCALVALSPISVALSDLVQMVLTSASGVRIYLQVGCPPPLHPPATTPSYPKLPQAPPSSSEAHPEANVACACVHCCRPCRLRARAPRRAQHSSSRHSPCRRRARATAAHCDACGGRCAHRRQPHRPHRPQCPAVIPTPTPTPTAHPPRWRNRRGQVLTAGEVTMLASGAEDSQPAGAELLCLTDLPLPPVRLRPPCPPLVRESPSRHDGVGGVRRGGIPSQLTLVVHAPCMLPACSLHAPCMLPACTRTSDIRPLCVLPV